MLRTALAGGDSSITMTNALPSRVIELIKPFSAQAGGLLPALHAVQDALGFIPDEAIAPIAETFNQSRAEVHGVISFFRHLRRTPPPRHRIEICRAESCQAMGSRTLEAHAQQTLGIGFGEQTEDGLFGLEEVYCLGNCACSPSVAINGRVFAHVSADRLDALLAGLLPEEQS